MEHRCLEPAELAALLEMPADDPRRAAAAACPRCDSLLRAGAAFLAGDDTVPPGELARAERTLAAVLAAQLTAPGAAAPASPRAVQARGRVSRRAGWGWGVGLAAALAAAMLMIAREPGVPAGPSGVLRGGGPAAGAAIELAVERTEPASDGSAKLSWAPVPGAETYRVELFTAALDTVGVLSVSEPAATVTADLAGREGDAAAVLCRVRARGQRGEVAVSPLRPVRLR